MKNSPARKIKVRRLWVINPRTRIKKSAKIYSREQAKLEAKKLLKEL